jgi:hypothetical protein
MYIKTLGRFSETLPISRFSFYFGLSFPSVKNPCANPWSSSFEKPFFDPELWNTVPIVSDTSKKNGPDGNRIYHCGDCGDDPPAISCN